MSTEATQRDPRPLHERIVSYLEGAGWKLAFETHDTRGYGKGYSEGVARATHVILAPKSPRYFVNDLLARDVAEYDGVPVSQVTGRTPNRAEKSLFAYMMGGPVPGFFRGQPRQSKKPVFWSCHKEEECYTATSRDEAIENYLRNDLTHDEWPREVTVWGVARELVDADDVPSYMLEEMVDRVGERYSADSTDDEWPRPTDAMIRAHEEFRETVRREFTPSTVVEVCSETVNVREWCQEHAPHWLPENITVSEGE